MQSRLTVTGHVYHQQQGEQPIAVPVTFSRPLLTDEQAYSRKLTIGPTWQLLDTGWVKRASMIVLRNEEGQFTVSIPTPQERAEAAAKVVEIGFGNDIADILLFPNEIQQFTPADDSIMVRCRSGEARITVTAIPE